MRTCFSANLEWSEIGPYVSCQLYPLYFKGLVNSSIVIYAAKNFRQVTIYALEATLPSEARSPTRRREGSLSFRSLGDVRNPINHRFCPSSDCRTPYTAFRCTERCIWSYTSNEDNRNLHRERYRCCGSNQVGDLVVSGKFNLSDSYCAV